MNFKKFLYCFVFCVVVFCVSFYKYINTYTYTVKPLYSGQHCMITFVFCLDKKTKSQDSSLYFLTYMS